MRPVFNVSKIIFALVLIIAGSVIPLKFISAAVNTAPQILYTDITSGPNSGGENNKGAYLSIFGKNFGSTGLGAAVKVYINNVEVDNYRYLGVSKGRSDIQQITVQVGALGNPTPGVALPIAVVVSGVTSNTDITFMVNPGKFYFVDNVNGNDATGVVNDITHPYRHVQTGTLSQAVWGQVKPGDIIIMRAGVWQDLGFENYFMRFRDKSGSSPTGVSGTGPITLMSYPGEDVFINMTYAVSARGAISAINGGSFVGMGQWATIADLRVEGGGDDGAINQEVYGDHWRVVNNDVTATTAQTTARAGGIVGNGVGSVWLGNHIHNVSGNGQENHGFYIDGDGSYEIGYNLVENITGGNGFQIYANGSNGSSAANNVNLHHNIIHDVNKHGINIADGAQNGIVISNNLVYNTKVGGIRFNTTTLHGAKIYNNTFYNTDTGANSSYGAIMNDWNLPSDALDVENNIFWPHVNTPYNGGSNGVGSGSGIFTKNLWYGGTGSFSFDTSPITGNPSFLNPGIDFHLYAGSAAINVGTSAVSGVVTNDHDVTTSRPQGVAYDIGAYEYVSAGGTPPPPTPTVTISASPTSVTSGSSSTLTWSTTNATSCTASGGWTGTKATGGSQSLTSLTTTGTYTLSCTGTGGTVTQSATVTVTSAADTTAPTTPTGLSATAVSTSQINLSWSAATDNIGVTGYNVYRNGTQIASVAATSYNDTGLVAGTTYSYTVSATDGAGNTSAQSTSVSATTNTTPPAGSCLVSNTTSWQNTSFLNQTGAFNVTFDATPNNANMDGVVGISASSATAYTSLAAIARFNPSGFIDARNGSVYSATSVVPYTSGSNYHFRLVLDVSTHLYSIYVTPPASSEITLGTNYAFRTEQNTVSILSNWALFAATGSHNVCNFAVSSVTTPPPTCTSFTYSSWNSCQLDNTQSRTIISSSPQSCTGGTPTLSQSCTYIPPLCTSFTYSSWNTCQSNNTQSRTTTASSPQGCTAGTPILTQSCTYTPPVTPTQTTCTTFTYSTWGTCQSDSTQSRTTTSTSPQGCTGGTPTLSQSCTYTPPVTTPPATSSGGTTSSSGGGGSVTTSSGGTTSSGSSSSAGTGGEIVTGGTTTTSSGTTNPTTGITTTGTTTLPPVQGPFSIGMNNDEVKKLQNMLKQDGVFTGDSTGYYGALTQKGVEAFQTKYNLITSGTPSTTGFGLAGPSTRAKLNSLYAGSGGSFTDRETLLASLRKQVAELTAILQTLIAKLAAIRAGQGVR